MQMLNIFMQNFGIIKEALDWDKLISWKDVYKKGKVHSMINGDPCWGIDKRSYAYSWCLKNVMPIIWKNFNKDEQLIYSAYKDMKSPFGIHRDLKPLPEGVEGVHSLSILFPLSADGSVDKINKIGTNFFDDDGKLAESILWEPNSIIWWKSEILHSASDFRDEGIKSKQFYITHTYV